jgi:acetyltransferase-like isoleucine patch superfamily enzyme
MIKKIIFWMKARRLGPDMPLTHILLHSRRLGYKLCQKKFDLFDEGSSFRPGAYAIETDKISIGKHVTIRPGTMLFASPLSSDIQIRIGDYALIGSGVHVYVSNHAFEDTERPIYFQGHGAVRPVIIEEGCWIGANAIILPGVTIGKNAVVGAGSVVTKNVADYSVVAGIPARVIK